MKYLLLLTLMGCGKANLIKKTRSQHGNDVNCILVLGEQVEKTGCKTLQVEYRKKSTLIRCKRPDEERGPFWDNYVFKISSAKQRISQEFLPEIEKHTICIDKNIRIEAYAP